ncbi:NSS family neurotransmitter:Na+ symporter [Clostridium tetanomorphum]|uniref:sodium-dependent transporter n=1 Tax=Clostridium tetanomorphum TaxID=1553 RepID=UPI000445F92D|nr:sodium-dependent transporter [Clostridium tetanomorphum]KAJ52618.1 sodium-dependent symporter family protein [Clostridium tetanomorphum DSM 665]MBP1863211.1 NSS family neurotransmitter:Na+ symporter [Clostridium tetanomorphum]NRS84319.1 NSS family neurotransmitter:Na+ symporter [Clostridium tetanomorphum]SQB92287.1 sodium-dependent symporter family protein [Clostridium tetanomorphum]
MKRESFSGTIAVFFATLGSAVGLGNIWKFPYVVGENGGGAFLLIYLICIMFVGIPVMVSEFYIGRKTHKNVMGAIKELTPNPFWKIIGTFGIFSAYFIMFFYSCVAGWVYSYVFKAIKGDLANVTTASVGELFSKTVAGPLPPLVWQFIAITVVSLILIKGVEKGIERVTKTLIPVLFILIIVCGIRALTLPGASEGLKFLFKVDFSKTTPGVILAAMGLAFFKLSLGMGTMVTYGSYFTKDTNLLTTSAKVAVADTIVSLLAGIAIFPAVFSFGMKPEAGPGLLFMTIPLVFSKLPFGNILLVIFFFLTAIAATTAMISIVEVLIAYYTEERGFKRRSAVIINAIIILLIGSLATLSADKTSILGNIHVFLGKGFFDTFDFISSNILLPLGGLLIAIFVGYFVNKQSVSNELTNNETLQNNRIITAYRYILMGVTPILLIIVFLNSLNIIKF